MCAARALRFLCLRLDNKQGGEIHLGVYSDRVDTISGVVDYESNKPRKLH